MAADKESAIAPNAPRLSAEAASIDDLKAPPVAADARELYELYHQAPEDAEVDAAATKKVLRKIDMRVLPMLFFTYFLQFLDKSGINYASVYGLQKGTHLHGQNYAWLGQRHLLLCLEAYG